MSAIAHKDFSLPYINKLFSPLQPIEPLLKKSDGKRVKSREDKGRKSFKGQSSFFARGRVASKVPSSHAFTFSLLFLPFVLEVLYLPFYY